MAKRRNLKKEIEDCCEKLSVSIPTGFHRHTPSRYAVIKADNFGAKKLVAKTWFNVEDFVYYIENNLTEENFELVDFKECSYLECKGSRLLKTLPLDGAT